MSYRDGRRSVCLSSQSGCPLTCTFCATGQMRFGRNLSADEILDQALHFRRIEAIDHVVFMGMGEPTMNIDAVLEACERAPGPRRHPPAHGDLHRRLGPGDRPARRVRDADRPRPLPARPQRRPALAADARQRPLPPCRGARRMRSLPGPSPAQGLRRVRDARRGQRPARARPPARRAARPPRLQGQPDPLQPDRRLRRLPPGADRPLPRDPRRERPDRDGPPHPRP